MDSRWLSFLLSFDGLFGVVHHFQTQPYLTSGQDFSDPAKNNDNTITIITNSCTTTFRVGWCRSIILIHFGDCSRPDMDVSYKSTVNPPSSGLYLWPLSIEFFNSGVCQKSDHGLLQMLPQCPNNGVQWRFLWIARCFAKQTVMGNSKCQKPSRIWCFPVGCYDLVYGITSKKKKGDMNMLSKWHDLLPYACVYIYIYIHVCTYIYIYIYVYLDIQ